MLLRLGERVPYNPNTHNKASLTHIQSYPVLGVIFLSMRIEADLDCPTLLVPARKWLLSGGCVTPGSCRSASRQGDGACFSRTFALSVFVLLPTSTRRPAPTSKPHVPLLAIEFPMLRSSLRSARLLGGKPIAAAAGRQWPIAASRRAGPLGIVSSLQKHFHVQAMGSDSR